MKIQNLGKIILVVIAIPILFLGGLALSLWIQFETNGRYTLLGPRPVLEVREEAGGFGDFVIHRGVWGTETMEVRRAESSSELLWKIRFIESDKVSEYTLLSYGEIPLSNAEQLFPENQRQLPVSLSEGDIVEVIAKSYCGHGFEQPNCLDARIFEYRNGSFKMQYVKE